MPAPYVKLKSLAIPGSHDSGAYFTREGVPQCGWEPVMAITPSFTSNWARTQHYDLYTQAELGARSFDIRPWWNDSQKELRTCHTLDTASFDDVFTSLKPGNTGLNKFAQDHPKEVMIINLSHFKTGFNNDTPGYNRAIDGLAEYLRKNVCPKAIGPKFSKTGLAGDLRLHTMWTRQKNYVVLADNDYNLYSRLKDREGMSDCIFSSQDNLSGDYAGEQNSVSYGDGYTSSTNLWKGLVQESKCKYVGKIEVLFWTVYEPNCTYGKGSENASTVRLATEKVLLDAIKGDRKSLYQTTYIWAYGTWADFGEAGLAGVIHFSPDANLIKATEQKEMVGNERYGYRVQAGILPYTNNFIEQLEQAAKESQRDVNIVNMDAIGKSSESHYQFMVPMMQINQCHLWDCSFAYTKSSG